MTELLTPLATIFVVSAVFLLAAKYVGIPSVPVYIVVGILIAPLIGRGETLVLAQFGIAFLVFVFGVYVEPERLRLVATDSEHIAAIQFLLIGGVAVAGALLFGLRPLDAIYIGIATSLSSSLVGRELLGENIHLDLVYGRLTQSIHFVQDLFAVLFVLLLSATAFELDAIAVELGYGVMVLVAALFVRVYVFTQLVRLSTGSEEVIALTGIALLVVFVAGAELLGVSIVVGAFAAGAAIKLRFEGNLALLNALDSLESFFTAIFFVTLGSLVALPTIHTALLAASLTIFVVVVKPLVTITALVRRGYEVRTATLTSLRLDQVSEFALIIAIQALILDRIDPGVFDAIVLAAAATMITSTVTQQHDERFFRWLDGWLPYESAHERTRNRSAVDPDIAEHVVVIGYGQLGRQVVRTCEQLGQSYVVVDHNPEEFDAVRYECDNYVFGDVMSDITREFARVDRAQVLISTTPDRRVTEYLLALDSTSDVFVRARTSDEAESLYEAGAEYVMVPDDLAAGALLETLDSALTGSVTPGGLRRSEQRSLREFKRLNGR
ncbi:cation:proton antiporter [Halorubrum sp. AD140]|uniref:cation:proton antiporter n=1 Tax=Halorubrum sp. AD140 TaxID=3050073 RepID=UPI002ACCE07D|nr:cation:proton antiporter [Halorubrum sp. AD140]MDZ5811462.1 cation:proton antiporter [Halorubrum sp. AD140]